MTTAAQRMNATDMAEMLTTPHHEDGALVWLDRESIEWKLGPDDVVFKDASSFLSRESEIPGPFDYPATTLGGVTLGPLEDVPTPEHVFRAFKALLAGHASKSARVLEARKPSTCRGITGPRNMPMTAKQLSAWEQLAPAVMLSALRAKFDGDDGVAALMLAETGDARIVEQQARGRMAERRWGVDRRGVGCNLLGQILMRVRGELERR
jgi:predicted NAD-dependent protein-ADP-ribosyltransferase YbiA (DUF1768 family)